MLPSAGPGAGALSEGARPFSFSMIRILRFLQVNKGRAVPLLSPISFVDLAPGLTLALPEELEARLIREGYAARIREKAVITAGDRHGFETR